MTINLEIAHITIDGKEIDETTPIDKKQVTTQKAADVLKSFNEKKPMFIKFYATWCGHCKTVDGPWKEVIKSAKAKYADKNIAIVEVESKVMNKEMNTIINGTQGLKVDGFPTIGSITYNAAGKASFTPYEGERNANAMLKTVESLANGKGAKEMGGGTKRSSRTKRKKSKSKKAKRSRTKRSRTKRRTY
jgi:thiol-disulfide isomerase/thioredoxin